MYSVVVASSTAAVDCTNMSLQMVLMVVAAAALILACLKLNFPTLNCAVF